MPFAIFAFFAMMLLLLLLLCTLIISCGFSYNGNESHFIDIGFNRSNCSTRLRLRCKPRDRIVANPSWTCDAFIADMLKWSALFPSRKQWDSQLFAIWIYAKCEVCLQIMRITFNCKIAINSFHFWWFPWNWLRFSYKKNIYGFFYISQFEKRFLCAVERTRFELLSSSKAAAAA